MMWESYRGGWAWVRMYCGFPVRVKVLAGGELEDYPGHIGLCSVISRTRDLRLRYAATGGCDWWTLRNRKGQLVAARRTPAGRMFRRTNPPRRGRIPVLVVKGVEAVALS